MKKINFNNIIVNRLETHLKEKLHDMLTRSSRMNKDEEADYQRLADANEGQRSPGVPTQQAVRALVHRSCFNNFYSLKKSYPFLVMLSYIN